MSLADGAHSIFPVFITKRYSTLISTHEKKQKVQIININTMCLHKWGYRGAEFQANVCIHVLDAMLVALNQVGGTLLACCHICTPVQLRRICRGLEPCPEGKHMNEFMKYKKTCLNVSSVTVCT